MSKSEKSILSLHRNLASSTVSPWTLMVMRDRSQKAMLNTMRGRIMFPFLVATGAIKLPEPPKPLPQP